MKYFLHTILRILFIIGLFFSVFIIHKLFLSPSTETGFAAAATLLFHFFLALLIGILSLVVEGIYWHQKSQFVKRNINATLSSLIITFLILLYFFQ